MKMYKKVCTCEYHWLSDDKKDMECPFAGSDDRVHVVTNSINFTSEDYVEFWSADLENANRHDIVDMPNTIWIIVKKVTKSEPQTKEIMKQLFEKEVGI